MTQVAFKQDFTSNDPILYMAFDLSHKSWKIAFSDGARKRYCTVAGKDLEALSAAIGGIPPAISVTGGCPHCELF